MTKHQKTRHHTCVSYLLAYLTSSLCFGLMTSSLRFGLMALSFCACLSACKKHPCESTHDRRPGWDEAAAQPELPFLAAPDRSAGCRAESTAPSFLGCPSLVNGEKPLSANFDPQKVPPRGIYYIYLLTSPDGKNWALRPEPLLHSFSSLGLLIQEDALYLFGSTQIPVFTPYAIITALRTTDLLAWEGCAWNICQEVNKGLVDTQPVVLPGGGLRMWYYSVPNPPDGSFSDPASLQGAHEMVFADYQSPCFFARGVGFGERNLADPTVVYYRNSWWMAVSQDAHRVLLASSEDGTRFQRLNRTFEGVSVPYLFEQDGELWLLTQRYRDATGPWPYLFVSRDGIDWQDRGYVVTGRPDFGCTSPVMGRFKGQYVLFCASFRPGGGHAPPNEGPQTIHPHAPPPIGRSPSRAPSHSPKPK